MAPMPDVETEQRQLVAELAIYAALGVTQIAVDLARRGMLEPAVLERLHAHLERATTRLAPEQAGSVMQLQLLLSQATAGGHDR
jgi:hypothetical protein